MVWCWSNGILEMNKNLCMEPSIYTYDFLHMNFCLCEYFFTFCFVTFVSLSVISLLESDVSSKQHSHQVSEGHWKRGTAFGLNPVVCETRTFIPEKKLLAYCVCFACFFQYNYTFVVEESAAKRTRPTLPAGGAAAAQWSLSGCSSGYRRRATTVFVHSWLLISVYDVIIYKKWAKEEVFIWGRHPYI